MTRFVVAVTHGDLTPRTGHTADPGNASAMVLDRDDAFRVVANYSTEGKQVGSARRKTVAGS